MTRRAFWLLVSASIGFWVDEVLHLIYRRTLHATTRRRTA